MIIDAIRRLRLRGSMLCIIVLLCVRLSHAGTIHTRDGQDLHGELHLDSDAVSVRSADGAESHFTLNEISHIDFAQEPAAPLTDAPGLGGLKGEYFLGTNYDQNRRKILRLDPTINFTWKFSRDAALLPNEWTWVPFCVRWTGQIRPLFSENYTLRIRDPLPDGGDIHGRLWIDRKLVIDDGADSGEIHLDAGHLYDLKFESIPARSDHRGKPSLARLTWESQSQRRQIVPATCLYVSPDAPDAPVVSRIVSLPPDSMVYAPCDIPIEAKVEPGRRVLDRVDLLADSAVLHIFQAAPYQYNWLKSPPLGDYQIGILAITRDGGKWSSAHARVIVADNNGGKIPKPWARFNIGDSAQEPAAITDQKITLSRTGGELYAKQDKFQFVYQMLTGDGEITAKLSDLNTDAPNAQPTAGLMIRRSLTDNSRDCGVLFQPGVGTVFLNRGFEGEASLNSPSATATAGYLRLVRDGQNIRAYRSEDGTIWQFVDQKEIDFPATVLIGVALSGQSAGRANAVFDTATVISTGLHNFTENGTGLILTDGSQLNGDIAGIEKGIVTLQRGDKKTGQRITVELKTIARINFHRPETPSTEQLDPAWRGVLLSHGDLFEGEAKIRSAHDIRVSSDVFGPRTFNAQYDLASVIIASVQPRPAAYDLALSDGSVLHCDKVELVVDGINVDTLFAKGLHLDVKDLSELTVTLPPK